MTDITLETLFTRIATSKFRSQFSLNIKEAAYLKNRGLDVIQQHASEFIQQRLASINPVNDGKQTSWKGHSVFVAQHATATCCRGCLLKRHGISKNKLLSYKEQDYILQVILYWLRKHS